MKLSYMLLFVPSALAQSYSYGRGPGDKDHDYYYAEGGPNDEGHGEYNGPCPMEMSVLQECLGSRYGECMACVESPHGEETNPETEIIDAVVACTVTGEVCATCKNELEVFAACGIHEMEEEEAAEEEMSYGAAYRDHDGNGDEHYYYPSEEIPDDSGSDNNPCKDEDDVLETCLDAGSEDAYNLCMDCLQSSYMVTSGEMDAAQMMNKAIVDCTGVGGTCTVCEEELMSVAECNINEMEEDGGMGEDMSYGYSDEHDEAYVKIA